VLSLLLYSTHPSFRLVVKIVFFPSGTDPRCGNEGRVKCQPIGVYPRFPCEMPFQWTPFRLISLSFNFVPFVVVPGTTLAAPLVDFTFQESSVSFSPRPPCSPRAPGVTRADSNRSPISSAAKLFAYRCLRPSAFLLRKCTLFSRELLCYISPPLAFLSLISFAVL